MATTQEVELSLSEAFVKNIRRICNRGQADVVAGFIRDLPFKEGLEEVEKAWKLQMRTLGCFDDEFGVVAALHRKKQEAEAEAEAKMRRHDHELLDS